MIKPVSSFAALVATLFASPTFAATFSDTLAFEIPSASAELPGWNVYPPGTVLRDTATVRGGGGAALIERNASTSEAFSVLTGSIPLNFTGDTLELRGWLSTRDVKGWAGLWLRVDGPSGVLHFDNMQSRNLAGTTPWTEYRLRLPLDENGNRIWFGALLAGTGKTHVDDLQLLVDGRPFSEAPALVRAPTALDTDREFDAGSKITADSLSAAQIENLVLLGKVWGFLKYHHPRVTAGKLHWDYELFRIMPRVLGASSRDEARARLTAWIDTLGVPDSCSPCAALPESMVHLQPPSDWIKDRRMLGSELSGRLQRVHKNRSATREQFYLTLMGGVGNGNFSNELPYEKSPYPDAGFRLLSLYRFWNIIEYWFPYRDLIKENWDSVLREFVPRMVSASDEEAYRLAALALAARVKDGHAAVTGRGPARPPKGRCRLPVTVRAIGARYVVDGLSDSALAVASGLKIGDVILKLDGRSVDSLTKAWTPYFGVSNEASRRHEMAKVLTQGDCGSCRTEVERGGQRFELQAARDSSWRRSPASITHDRPGPAFQKLSDEVAYLKLSAVATKDIPSYLGQAAGTKCFVIDIRNYPKEFVPFALGQHLVTRKTPFARFTLGDPTNPGAFLWGALAEIEPRAPRYGGKVAVLVDEVSISQSEYTAMAFRACGGLVVGSTTAGADGNVSSILLPGNLRASISGIGVFYPNKRPTQQIGIVPDLVVRPTIEGLMAGRDEVLEAAVAKVLGRSVALPKP